MIFEILKPKTPAQIACAVDAAKKLDYESVKWVYQQHIRKDR